MSDVTLTLGQADRVREVWGIFLEYTNSSLLYFFLGDIPESFLPYPKFVIEEAMDMLDRHFRSQGQIEAADAMSNSKASLMGYASDDEVIKKLAHSLQDRARADAVKQRMANRQAKNVEDLLKNY